MHLEVAMQIKLALHLKGATSRSPKKFLKGFYDILGIVFWLLIGNEATLKTPSNIWLQKHTTSKP